MAKKANITQKAKLPTRQAPLIVNKSQEPKPGIIDYLRFGESYTSLILGIIVVIIATILLLSFVHSKNAPKSNITQTALSTKQLVQNQQKVTQVSGVPTPKPTTETRKKVTPTVASIPAKINKPTEQPKSKKENIAIKVNEAQTSEKTYTITHGDSLWSIAEKFYNDGYKWSLIASANNLNDPNLIHSGNKITLPKIQNVVASTSINETSKQLIVQNNTSTQVSSASEKITGSEYTVVKGDTLWNVSVRAYGDGFQWAKIAQANGLANPGIIHSGNVLKIPRNS